MEHLGSGNVRNKPSSIAAKKNWSRSGCWSRWGSPCWSPVLGLEGPNRRRCGFAVTGCGGLRKKKKNVVLLGLSKWCLINAIYIYMYYTTRWWQLKYVSNFHLENWGRWFPIWRAYFSKGLKPPTRWCFFLDDDIWAFTLQNGGGNWKKKQHLKMMTTWTSWGNCRYTYCICTRI